MKHPNIFSGFITLHQLEIRKDYVFAICEKSNL